MEIIERAKAQALDGAGCDGVLALELLQTPDSALDELLDAAWEVRQQRFGRGVDLCAIVNAKSGLCPQDCAFCAQSVNYSTAAKLYPLLDVAQVLQAATAAKRNGAKRFAVVTSGPKPRPDELERIAEMVAGIAGLGLGPCVSLGLLSAAKLELLKAAGLRRVHRNLETCRSFYERICTTRDWMENLIAAQAAKAAGLELCSGGILGLGESLGQRVQLAVALREAGVHSVALNFLHPIPGTPLQDMNELRPEDCLRATAVFRLLLPAAEIVICGGREHNLGERQNQMFRAGASGLMIGDYLTTAGPGAERDRRMLDALGLEVRPWT